MEFYAKKFRELTGAEVYEILKSRAEIFVCEQNIVYQDMDDVDYDALHCFFVSDGRVSSYLRAFYTDDGRVQLGRVLTIGHGRGEGRALMEKSLTAVKENMKCDKICLNAQKYAIGFYEKFGFKVISGEFLEDGIVHVAMETDV